MSHTTNNLIVHKWKMCDRHVFVYVMHIQKMLWTLYMYLDITLDILYIN